jgi:hypothetical protein
MKALRYIQQEWLAFVAAVLLPVAPSLFLIGLLIIADTFTGIWAAKKRSENILSFRMFNGIIPKVILYPLGIILASGFEHLYPEIPAIKVTAFLFISIEVKSLSENFSTILGMPFVKWIKLLIFKGKKNFTNELFNNDKTP